MLTTGGYPNDAGPDPAHPGGLSINDCVTIENFPKALCFAFRTDNSGPPLSVTVSQYIAVHLRNEFNFWNVHEIMNTSCLLQSK